LIYQLGSIYYYSGLGSSLGLVIMGRVVTGIGGAGASALVSLIILGIVAVGANFTILTVR
jgi:hypothetical protein